MKKLIFIPFILLIIFSCTNQRVKNLQEENRQLKDRIDTLSTWLAKERVERSISEYKPGANRTPEEQELLEAGAYLAAKKFVGQNLKSPSTAKFAKYGDENTSVTSNGNQFSVRLWVDAQNTLGAMVREIFLVEMIYDSASDSWNLIKITSLQ